MNKKTILFLHKLKNIINVGLYLLLIIAFFILQIFSSCHTSRQNSNGKKVFRYNESKNIASLDPAFARNSSAIWPVIQLYNGLVQLDDSLNIEPCIAKSWDISSDRKTYIFHLRNDVLFHESPLFRGTKRTVIASDVVYSYNRIMDETTASPGAWVFNVIDIDFPGTNNGMKIINDSTLEIHLKSPFPAFLGLLATPYCFIVPYEVVEYYGRDFREHPVGTGPFKFKFWKESEKLIFVKNERYFEKDADGSKLPKIDAVSISFIPDKQSEFLEFIKGRIDFISGVNAAFKDEVLTSAGKLNDKYKDKITMLTGPYLNTEYFGMLVDKDLDIVKTSPLNNIYVRKAINISIDRKKMISFLRNNIGYPANAGFVPKGLPSFSDSLKGYVYDPDSARKLLKIAGFSEGKGLRPLKIITVTDYLDLCEYVQHELAQVQIPMEIEVVTGLAYREMLTNSRVNLFRASWVADYPDAENYLALFYSKNFSPRGPNYTHFKNAEYDHLYELSLNETDINNRYKLYRQMDQKIIDEAITIPLFYDMAVRFVQKNVTGLGINPMNILVLKHVQMK